MVLRSPDVRDDRLTPLSFVAWSTAPAMSAPDVHSLVTVDGNRWSVADQPTLYLASDEAVAIAEAGRHWSERSGPLAMCRATVTLDAVADLRRRDRWSSLLIPADPCWLLDRERCRGIAARLRDAGECDGMIVPSAAFLDDPSKWNAVVFVDRLGTDLSSAVAVEAPTVGVGPVPTRASLVWEDDAHRRRADAAPRTYRPGQEPPRIVQGPWRDSR